MIIKKGSKNIKSAKVVKKETKKESSNKANKAKVKNKVSKVPAPLSIKASASDKRWQEENDAQTLMQAEEIKNDSKRFNSAKSIVAAQLETGKKIITGNK